MDDRTFEAVTRRAAAVVSRRSSLSTLGGAALAAGLLTPISAPAKGGKKKDRCKNQVSRCKAGLADLCDAAFPPAEMIGPEATSAASECLAAFDQCCQFLSDCSVAQAFACAVEVVESLEPK
jgi:hypothetical protein